MFDWLTLHVLALVAVAAQFGGMAFFAFLFTPLAFRFMAREQAGDFLRQVFPVYHRVMAGLAIVPAFALAPGGEAYTVEVTIMAVVAATFLIAARLLVPAADRARTAGDERRFAMIHRSSVALHMVQWVAVTLVLVQLAQ